MKTRNIKAPPAEAATVSEAATTPPAEPPSASARQPGEEPSDASLQPPPSEELSRQWIKLGFLIHDVSRLRRSAYDQLMKPLKITRARWWVLAHLSRHDGMMQSQLADVLEVGKASLGTVVDQLENSGWVERRADPLDKRVKRVYLTRAAQPLIKTMTIEEDRFNQRALGALSLDDHQTLSRLLGQIKHSLSRMGVDSNNQSLDED
ncbi:MarR family winged helix-turn-helix transcriptional regulator [Nevskia sp.]|uniref:MarR family winged helix-turn-helix transcriptional regulator n=1 Tax=Nevskia sp. TaxID=1929292 RepID=UPI0025F026D3|nr:MarR family winged helix-turn-helix transcriptional regulator [Nevskia sp.]